MEDESFEFGVKWIAAEIIALALKDLGNSDPLKRADAKLWITKDGGDTFGFKWCIAVCGVSGNLIRRMVHQILHEGKKFEQLKRYMR